MKHLFEISGLGKAPFRYVAPSASKQREFTHQFFCEHCGTAIKNQHFIQSADLKISVVGVDCLKKSGDEGLVSEYKSEKSRLGFEKKELLRLEKIAAREKLERENNNGMTLAEVAKKEQADKDAWLSLLKEELEFTFGDGVVFKSLSASPFGLNMIEQASELSSFTKGQLAAVTKVVAKNMSGGARVGSKAYAAVLGEAANAVKELQEFLIKGEEKVYG